MLGLWVVITSCVGVLQLAVLAWATRSLRIATLLLAVVAGLYGAGMLALLLEWASTSLLTPLVADPVEVASWSIDPFIEEAAKIAPLLVAAACWPSLRAQWGVTDWLLAGSATGAGFGLLETLADLRSGAADAQLGVGGWLMPGMWVPDPWTVLTVWLPDPATMGTVTGETGVFHHLAWGALAGLGAGLAVRLRGPARVWGLAPYVLAGGMHAAYNHTIVDPPGMLLADAVLAPFNSAGAALGLWPLLALAVATGLDLPVLRRQKTAHPELRLTGEQASGPAAVTALARYARLHPPWTMWILCGWITLRRNTLYALAHTPAAAQPLRAEAAQIAGELRAPATEQAWAAVGLRRILNPPHAAARRPAWWRNWPWLLAAVLSLPTWWYWGAGTTPGITTPRDQITTGTGSLALVVVLLVAIVWTGWCLYMLLRALPGATTGHNHSGPLQVLQFRVTTAAGVLLLALVCCLNLAIGATGADPITSALGGAAPLTHVLEALDDLELAAGIALLAAAFLLFPPAGLIAVAGGGIIVVPTISTGFITLSALGLTGIALSQTGPSSSDPDSGGQGASSGGGQPAGAAGGRGPAAARVPDLSGRTLAEAEAELTAQGFRLAGQTKGGYRHWRHPDGSDIWIRPNGEIQRLGPKIDPGPNSKNYAPRYDRTGNPTPNHHTEEYVQR